MTTVILYGRLGKKFGKRWEFHHLQTVRHAVHAIDIFRPGFKRYIIDDLRDFMFHVQKDERTIGESELDTCVDNQTIKITPVLEGGISAKGVIELIAGVVLIAVGLFGPGLGITTFWGAELVLLGLGLALGGISALLTGKPGAGPGAARKNKPSYIFTNAVNTIDQGLPVPVALGQPYIGSAVVSVGVFAEDITTGSVQSPGSPTSGSGTGKGQAKPIAAQRAPTLG
jgi:predicted phage tail protein